MKKERARVATCMDIELLATRLFNTRAGIAVPNVHWGANIHECDVLIVSKAGWATEIEIKVSKSDLKKDSTKRHGHKSDKISNLYFAIPDKLLGCIELIPERAGIIVVRPYVSQDYGFFAEIFRQPIANNYAKKWTDQELKNLGRLGAMRIWNLKSTVRGLTNDNKHLREKIKQLENGLQKQNHTG